MSEASRCPDPLDLAREASDPSAARADAHLRACVACRSEVAGQRRLLALASALPAPSPDAGRVERVRAAVLAAACAPPASRRRLPLVAALGAAALLLLGAGLGLWRAARPGAGESPRAPAVAVRAQPGARFLRVSGPPDQIVRLREGALTVAVDPLGPGERFRVIVGDAEVEVHGTAFDVAACDDRLTEVRVLRGRVAVRPSGSAELWLLPGERWSSAPPAAAAPQPSLAASPAPAPESPAAPRVPAPRIARAAPLPSSRSEPTPVSIAAGPRALVPPRVEGRLVLARAEVASPPTGGADAGAPSERPLETPAEAAFAQGWTALRADEPEAAAVLFDRAVRAAGTADIGEDASYWRAVALGRAERPREYRRALRSFLDAYPTSNRAGEAAVMLARLLLAQGELAAARELFRAASEDPAERVREAARAGLETARSLSAEVGAHE